MKNRNSINPLGEKSRAEKQAYFHALNKKDHLNTTEGDFNDENGTDRSSFDSPNEEEKRPKQKEVNWSKIGAISALATLVFGATAFVWTIKVDVASLTTKIDNLPGMPTDKLDELEKGLSSLNTQFQVFKATTETYFNNLKKSE
jgi:hypothetical protein